MPGVWKEIDDAGRSGYCWYCHEWKSSSRVFQIWEGVGRDERDEYEGGFCPECEKNWMMIITAEYVVKVMVYWSILHMARICRDFIVPGVWWRQLTVIS